MTRRRLLSSSVFLLLLFTEAKCLLKCWAFLKSVVRVSVSVKMGFGFSFLFSPDMLFKRFHASFPLFRRLRFSHLFTQASFFDSLVISFALAMVFLYSIFFPTLSGSFSYSFLATSFSSVTFCSFSFQKGL